MISKLPTTVSIEIPLAKMLTQYKIRVKLSQKIKKQTKKKLIKKVNKATKFSTVKKQIGGIKLGTPHTALQSFPYYGDRTGAPNENVVQNHSKIALLNVF